MKLTHLELAQVRGFEQIEFTFQPDMNLLVGANGVGKSTVLDVLRILLSQVIPKFSPSRSPSDQFEERDIRIGREALTTDLSFHVRETEFDYLVRIPRDKYDVTSPEHIPEYKPASNIDRSTRIRRRREQLAGYRNLRIDELIPSESVVEMSSNADSPQPIAIYYSPHRSVVNRKKPSKTSSTSGAYAKALSNQRESEVRELAQWWLVEQALSSERDQPRFGDNMEVLSNAVVSFLDGCSNLRAVRKPQETLLVDKFDGTLDIDQLSDGERSLLAMVLDLARRLAIANPDFDDPLRDGEAIVLIDELDLHLHPQWQRNIVGRLTQAFPSCQFIATTHSPQIIGEVENRCVQILLREDERIINWSPPHSFGLDSNRILEDLMDVRIRTEDVDTKFDVLFELIDQGDYKEALNKIQQMENVVGSKEPELTRARALIAFLEGTE